MIFICVGAAVFTILSSRLAADKDPTRIAANIVTGIGFLGAGAILREGLKITGLTTAATIWLTAAVGMAIGGEQYLTAGIIVVAALVVLWVFPYFEFAIDRIREEISYEIACPANIETVEAIEAEIHQLGLFIRSSQHTRQGGVMKCRWSLAGSPKKHARLQLFLFNCEDVSEFTY
jgi:putative Mg2+ transporter-C (MgtC) family protein